MTLLIPVTTILLGYLMFGEGISPRESSVRL
jgi:drug/metabolite transporter (DMT)-like permease